MTKMLLFEAGKAHIERWCTANDIAPPTVVVTTTPTMFGTCAYYRDGEIAIWPAACAAIGRAGRAWSYPGHSVDRTPYGVLAHELGHHVDKAHGAAGGIYGTAWRATTGENPLTGYCDNDNEWFAELFRLFVTNPTLLAAMRPKTWRLMHETWRSVELRHWGSVLAGGERQLALVRKRLKWSTPHEHNRGERHANRRLNPRGSRREPPASAAGPRRPARQEVWSMRFDGQPSIRMVGRVW